MTNPSREPPQSPYINAPCEHCNGTGKIYAFNKGFGNDRLCRCGHPYYRHFDTYDEMRPIGCKYCDCMEWSEAPPVAEVAPKGIPADREREADALAGNPWYPTDESGLA